jgi:hypothetical protein
MGPREGDAAGSGTAGLTAAAMRALAANSLLCRGALGGGHAVPLALAVSAIGASLGPIRIDPLGPWLPLASGTVAPDIGYALWYATLRRLTGIRASLDRKFPR